MTCEASGPREERIQELIKKIKEQKRSLDNLYKKLWKEDNMLEEIYSEFNHHLGPSLY